MALGGTGGRKTGRGDGARADAVGPGKGRAPGLTGRTAPGLTGTVQGRQGGAGLWPICSLARADLARTGLD